jgi:glyoxylate carboligase
MDASSTTAFLPFALSYLALRAGNNADLAPALALADKLAQEIVAAPPARVPLSLELELERIVTIEFGAELQSVSPDTIERRDADRVAAGQPSQIIQLSTRRKGMRLKHALLLA